VLGYCKTLRNSIQEIHMTHVSEYPLLQSPKYASTSMEDGI